MRSYIDITNQKFGRLTAISLEPSIGKGARWMCLCECGQSKVVRATALRHGQIKSCGCLRKENTWEKKGRDLTGLTFGRLTALSSTKDKSGRASWVCSCQCGRTTTVRTGLLSSGNTKSCGCGQSKNQKRVVISGVYAICFASNIAKFGRSADIARRSWNYKREAIFSGGARLLYVACENFITVEKALIALASEKFEPILFETFRGVDFAQAASLLLLATGETPQELVGAFNSPAPASPAR